VFEDKAKAKDFYRDLDIGTKAKAKNSEPKPRTSKYHYYNDTLPSTGVTLVGFLTF